MLVYRQMLLSDDAFDGLVHSISLNNIKQPQLYGFHGLNIMEDRNYINYPRDSSNGMESRFKP